MLQIADALHNVVYLPTVAYLLWIRTTIILLFKTYTGPVRTTKEHWFFLMALFSEIPKPSSIPAAAGDCLHKQNCCSDLLNSEWHPGLSPD